MHRTVLSWAVQETGNLRNDLYRRQLFESCKCHYHNTKKKKGYAHMPAAPIPLTVLPTIIALCKTPHKREPVSKNAMAATRTYFAEYIYT